MHRTVCDNFKKLSCEYDKIFDFFRDDSKGDPRYLLCKENPPFVIDSEFAKSICDKTDDYRNHRLVGAHPKICSTSRDCPMVNEEYAPCKCSFNGFSYCALDYGDISVAEILTSACANDLPSLRMLYSYMLVYPLILDNNACLDSITEFINYEVALDASQISNIALLKEDWAI